MHSCKIEYAAVRKKNCSYTSSYLKRIFQSTEKFSFIARSACPRSIILTWEDHVTFSYFTDFFSNGWLIIHSFSLSLSIFQGPPNGSIHLTVPRAPPPPRAKSPPENQPLLQSATVSSRVSQATMSEMRVWCLDPPPKPVVPDVLTASTLL